MDYSRTGGATMRMPASNFSQSGLASMFGIDLDADTKAPRIPCRKKIAIIASTVCGIVGLAVVVVLGGYMAWRWRKVNAHIEDPIFEKDVHPDVHEGVVEQIVVQPKCITTDSRPDVFP